MLKFIPYIYFTTIVLFSKGQVIDRTLSSNQVIQLVKQFHPIVQQTTIDIDKAAAAVTVAKGNFDPLLNGNFGEKIFSNTNYYNNTIAAVTIPTWYGVDVNVGVESLLGQRLDPSNTGGQTSIVGVKVPLAKNLLMDKRRATLQQAKIFNTMSVVEQKIIINDILMEAMESYWNWVKNYETYVVLQNIVSVNEKRLELVKKAFKQGERPAIDTIEALTQLQSFQYLKNEKWVAFQNAGIELSLYLWTNKNENFILPESIKPINNWEKESANFNVPINDLLQNIETSNPSLQLYPYKLNALEIERKLKYQDLLPKIDFKFNRLGKDFNLLKTVSNPPLFQNNLQYGINIDIPLLFRNGKGNYKIAKLKIEETKLAQQQKTTTVIAKVKSYYNEFINLKNQQLLQENTYNNYLKLVKAEELRFFNGESSLFLINSRENKALESLEKLIEIKTKLNKTVYTIQWSAGLLQ
jgi:outer membrane protein TolC